MRVRDLEDEVFAKDEIRIVVRSPRSSDVGDYAYERKAADNTTLTDWLEQRIHPLLGENVRVEVIDGYGAIPHGNTRLSVVRSSYWR